MYNLTVGILTYNRAAYLKEMLDSLLAQTFNNFYIYISDNCSQDNTADVVSSYLQDPRILYHRHSESIGIKNFEYTLNRCITDYLIIAHDDDIMLPNMVKELYETISSSNSFAAVGCNCYLLEDKNKTKKTMFKSSKDYLHIEQKSLVEKYIEIGRAHV